MTDYKNTLNLPQTLFPMKANLAQVEPELLKYWESIQLYARLREKNRGKTPYILHDGPPYANGDIHIGHAVNKILKDIIVKAKSLSGFDAPFIPGWDCHGLPIELNIEKKYGPVGHKLSPPAFRQACREYAQKQVAIQRTAFQRLGVLADWANPYLTMDFKFEANIIRALGKILQQGHLQQGFKPVHWCIQCRSALAEAEVEYRDKTSLAIDVRFPVVESAEVWQRLNLTPQTCPISIPIWTTTPWSLPANQAVALNATVEYVLLQTKSECLLIAQDLVAACAQRYGLTDYQCLAVFPGQLLAGILLQHPFYARQVPVILGDHVTTETGTGAVHTAPAHGLEDYLVAQHYQIPMINSVADNGCFTPDTPLFAGQSVFKVNDSLLPVLSESGHLLAQAPIQHSYPHCWRHKIPLIFRATPQWFINLQQQGLRAQSLNAVKAVTWIPEWGQARIESMLENRPDWCISRQRTWGVPIPLFIHRYSNALHPKSAELLEKVAQQVEEQGMDAWYALEPETLLGAEAKEYQKLTDCLDVWFDSGVTHEALLKANPALAWPADLYLEGSDQHRGWFQSSLLTSVAMYNQAPYRAVLTHGFTVDEQGRKMSKSLGNVVAPDKVIKTLGADILRLWVASTDYRKEITVSDEILKRTAEAYRRIRNTLRFLLANLHDFDPTTDSVAPDQRLSLDNWILARTQQLQTEIITAYDEYQFHTIYQKLHNFCINELGGFYLDIIKDRQYTLQKASVARRSAQTALYHVTQAMVRWIAPILSFTAETLWQHLPGLREESVFLTEWYALPLSTHDPLAAIYPEGNGLIYWESLRLVRNEVNKVIEKQRISGQLGSSLEAEVRLYLMPETPLAQALSAIHSELKFVFITSDVSLQLGKVPESVPTVTVAQQTLGIEVTSTLGHKEKCARCWHRCADIGQNSAHPTLCQRCILNLPHGPGEVRHYA